MHIVGVVEPHRALTVDDMYASAQGKRISGAPPLVVEWEGCLYLFAEKDSELLQAAKRCKETSVDVAMQNTFRSRADIESYIAELQAVADKFWPKL
jgi:hypothetical protein